MKTLNAYERGAAHGLTTAVAVLLTGCAGLTPGAVTTVAPVASRGAALHGSVRGGQQAVVGANMLLFAAGTGGYGQATPNLLTAPVLTDNSGSFDITSDYSCTTGQQMFLLASGGNPGAGTNANSVVMAALGDCSSLSSTTFISINEITTVGSAFALAPFMPSGANAATTQNGVAYFAMGTSNNNAAGLARAFASVNKLVNIATGTSTGSALPANAVGPAAEINTLADVLSTCINSTGGQSNCGQLFGYATPASNVVPADTLQVAINIAQNPTLNTSNIYNLAPAASPFQPQLMAVPTDWTMSVKYKNVGLNAPKSATIDANGQIWVANSGGNNVTVLAQTGIPIAGSPFAGNSLSGPVAVAIDTTGNAWVADKTGNSLSVFTGSGAPVSGSPFTAGGNLAAPVALAFDAPGNLWVGNSASLVKLSSSGAYILTQTSGASSPSAIAINPK